MGRRSKHTEEEASQLRRVIRDWKIDFDTATTLDDWKSRRLPYEHLFQQILEIRTVTFTRYPQDTHSNKEWAFQKKLLVRRLQANAVRCRREKDNEAGWINNVASLVFESLSGFEFRCQICGEYLWLPDFVAHPRDAVASQRLSEKYRTRRICQCSVARRAVGVRVRPGSPSIFSNKSDEQVMHDVTGTEKVTVDQKYKRPDRVYGLSLTGSFDRFGNRLSKYSPFSGRHTIFPFMVVEAKSEKSEDGFHDIEQQTALSIRTCLKIQTSLEIESNLNLDPVVWFFGFRGDVWRLYIALPVNDRTKIIDCWHGRISSADEALQLLLIVDWICFWAKDVHRTAILKCLSGLETREITPASTVFSSQGDLNDGIPPTRSTSLVFRSSRPPVSRLENDQRHIGDEAVMTANVSQSELTQRGLRGSQSRLQGGDDAFSVVRNAREVVNEWHHFALPEDEDSMLECLAAICTRGNVQETAKLLWEALTDHSHTVKMSLRSISDLLRITIEHEATESASEEPMAVFLACQSRLSELSWQVTCTYWCVTSNQAAAHTLAAVAGITGAEVFSLNFWSAHDCDCLGSAIAGFQRLGGRAIAAAAISQDIFCIYTTHSRANAGHSEWLNSDREILQPRVAMLRVLFGHIGNTQQNELPTIAVPRPGEDYLPPNQLFGTDSLNGVPGVILKKPVSWPDTCPAWCYLSFELGGQDSIGQQIALALQQRAIYAASGLDPGEERSIEQWALSTMDIMQSIDASGS